MGLFGNCWDALKWGFSTNFSHIGRWLLLTILSIIPIICWFAEGALLKILKGEEPDIAPAGKSFVTGFFLFLIALIYVIVPCLIMMIPVIGWIIGIILTILVCLIMIPAEINFARSGKFSKAFAFGEIFGMISKLGWGKYILAIIVMIIFAILVSIVLSIIYFILGLIPVVGIILAIIIGILAFIPLLCWEFKYWNDVFA
ncbi:MAG TPA: DUF4013 domain-containing protein [Methanocorpusculum sp.]|nr:DUF4013 domain-containing protein [Methanocorpusculum sp.]